MLITQDVQLKKMINPRFETQSQKVGRQTKSPIKDHLVIKIVFRLKFRSKILKTKLYDLFLTGPDKTLTVGPLSLE